MFNILKNILVYKKNNLYNKKSQLLKPKIQIYKIKTSTLHQQIQTAVNINIYTCKTQK